MVRYNLCDGDFFTSDFTKLLALDKEYDFSIPRPKTEEETLADFVKGSKFPLTDVYQNSETGGLMLKYALSGYTKEELKVHTENSMIILEGNPAKCPEDENWIVLGKTIKCSKFTVKTPIPTKYDLSLIKVKFVNGTLIVTIPLAEDKKPIDIKIN